MTQPYQVIARRWRPQTFAAVVGQDHIVRTIRNAIDQKRIAHAYLFVGPRGTGKTSLARIFAKALNCEEGPKVDFDPNSPICQAIMNGTCMDVVEIDGASNNSVDQIRDLRDDCQYAPTQCRFKIYIIDEVHMLSSAAFNALLKTLEEPPAHVKFIFATTEAHKVLPTIVSRCQRFEFKPIADSVIAEKLKAIAKEEGLEAEDPAFVALARLAQGGMRDAQSALEQMIAFCGTKITEADVLEVYGLAADKDVKQLAQALAKADYAAILEGVAALNKQGADLYRVLLDLQTVVRGGLLDAVARQGTSNLLGHPLTIESFLRLLDALHAGEARVEKGLNETLDFEIALLKAAEQSRVRAIDTVIQALGKHTPPLAEAVQKKNKLNEASAEHKKALPEVGAATCEGIEEMMVRAAVAKEATSPSSVVAKEKENFHPGEAFVTAMPTLEEGDYSSDAERKDLSALDDRPLPSDGERKDGALEERPLLSLQEAIDHLPPSMRALLHEQFRAQFKRVCRLTKVE